jgi:3-hydroxyacyl-CoA dehydrogenase
MFYADMVGLVKIYGRILEFQRMFGPKYWQPAPLLERLAKAGSSFKQWQAERAGGAKATR